MIVFHHNDADGRCAAAIVNKWFKSYGNAIEGLRFVELDYKDRVPVEMVHDGEEITIVDFSFKPEVMAEVLKRTDRINWCDHHKTAAAYDYGRELAGVRDFTERGRSGCECTWDFFFPNDGEPDGLLLLGDYDAWRLEMQPRTFAFYEGLKLHDQRPTSRLWEDLLANGPIAIGTVDTICKQGQVALQYRDNYCREIRDSFGYETEIDGVRAYAVNVYRFGSKGFGDKWGRYPICIAYIHDGNKFTVSLYSAAVDVGEIAQRHGGGGHKGASGFICDTLPFCRGKES